MLMRQSPSLCLCAGFGVNLRSVAPYDVAPASSRPATSQLYPVDFDFDAGALRRRRVGLAESGSAVDASCFMV